MSPDRYDVAIIGGGPAGSTAATCLAKAGKRVTVLEKETFPRFHIGESLLPYNMPIFEELGVREKIEKAGFIPKYGARFCLADASMETLFRFGDGRYTEQPMSYQVERARFDSILLRHAGECGADILEDTRITGYTTTGDGVTLERGKEADPILARFLIDASGQSNFTGNRERLRIFSPKLKNVAIYGHFSGIRLPAGSERGDIVIYRLDEAWFWFIPLGDDRVSLGLVVARTQVKERSPKELFEEAIALSPALASRLEKRVSLTPLHSVSDYSYTNKKFVGERLIRAGDAAGFLDPIFSSGVYLAMVSGKMAATALADALPQDRPLTRSMLSYEKTLRETMRVYSSLIEGFYTRPFMELLMQPQDILQLPAAINAILAGRLDQPWRIRWRMRVFHMLVRMQHTIPVVPRIPIPTFR